MASDEEVKLNCEENFEWNVENEIRLFEAIIGHKPVGINKHFHMACISENFENLTGKPVSSDVIWKHLGSMFDLAALGLHMKGYERNAKNFVITTLAVFPLFISLCVSVARKLKALDKKDSLPFPNEPEEFSLPEAEFSDLINEKLASKIENTAEIKESTKDIKPPAKVIKDSTPAKEPGSKREKKLDLEEIGSNNELDKKENVELESESKRVKGSKEEKPIKRRGFRGVKEKKVEEETSQTPTSVYKKEESPLMGSGNKKDRKQGVGKRSLRSRADDSLSNKSLTPPPSKRGRRI